MLEHYGPQGSYLHCSAIVWPAAEALRARGSADFSTGATVTELGAGTGWFGLCLARSRPDLVIWVTETAESGALARLRSNMTGAADKLLSGVAPRVAELDWRDFLREDSDAPPRSAPLQSCDWVVGSDLVYSEGGAAALCAVLGKALRRRPTAPRCLIAHTCERFGFADEALLRELRVQRLRAVPLSGDIETDPAAQTRQRVVVFGISPVEARALDQGGVGNCAGESAATPGGTVDALAESVLLRSRRAWDHYLASLSSEEREEIELGQAMARMMEEGLA